ncbi:hypothetical protein NIES4102_39650 (plasmid) [Chondrocystis sp. NIES-4102]|nr:hypothetical protein NIES4102_39650 [Chondrocystis sp. NIES-4102]
MILILSLNVYSNEQIDYFNYETIMKKIVLMLDYEKIMRKNH